MVETIDSLPDRPLTLNEVNVIANIDSIDILYHFGESEFDESVFEFASVDETEDGVVMIIYLKGREAFILTCGDGGWEKDLFDDDIGTEEFKVTGDLIRTYGNWPDELEEFL